jgi:predicted nicotinamide N-methyase
MQWARKSANIEAIIAELTAKFPIQLEEVRVAGRSFQIHSVANPHETIDHLMGQVVNGDFQWEPFWAQAWPSSRFLAEWMCETNEVVWPETAVLDLGCGVGLCGCVAASLGARVVMADYAEPAVAFAVLNSWPWRSQVTAEVLDWHRDTLDDKFSVILGADIVYEQRNWLALDRFFKRHLLPGGQVILTEPGRETGHSVQDFLRSHGWSLKASGLASLDNGRTLRLLNASINLS